MADLEHLEERFQMIKEFAWKSEELPKYQGENAFSFVDEHYFQAMRHMYARYRLHTIRRELAEQEVNKYRLCYIRDKTSEETMARGYREFSEGRRGIGEWTKALIKNEGKSVRELFTLLFCQLLPAVTDPVTAKLIKENTGYALITGSGKLSEEEIKEVEKWL